ncbi:hypothetical protein J6590_053818 [Homalodisca vitripennis]|nr:hypothetical protein J6590_053818 [Homalodisca vitripennis]
MTYEAASLSLPFASLVRAILSVKPSPSHATTHPRSGEQSTFLNSLMSSTRVRLKGQAVASHTRTHKRGELGPAGSVPSYTCYPPNNEYHNE